MIVKYCLRYWPALALLAAALWLPSVSVEAGKLYKWKDENGVTRYGDKIPPQYAKQRTETLSNRGIVLETKPAAKTRQQLAEEQRLEKLRIEEQNRQRAQAVKDRILLDTFTNEDEMIMTRNGKIEAIEAVIRVTAGRIEKTRARLAELSRRAANMERAGKPVPDTLSTQITDARHQIQQNVAYIERRKQEQQAIREKFEADIQHFRKLKSEQKKLLSSKQ
jgi:hypothetical protein